MIKKIFKIVATIIKIFLVLTIVLFVGFVLLQRLSNNNKTVLGYRMFAVVTGSMEPVYKIGDVILVKTVDTNTLKEGDDVTYLGKEASFKDKVITHRIIKIEEKSGVKVFHTKGVATNSEDPTIEGNQIYGKVTKKLTILSFFHKYSSGNVGFFFFVVLPIMLLVGTEIVQTMLEKYEKKAKKTIDQNNQSVHEQILTAQADENQVQEEIHNVSNQLVIPAQATVEPAQQQVQQPTEEQLQQELQALQQQVAAQQQVQQPTEEQLQQELQALQQQVAAQQQVQQQPTEEQLQQELQALQQQVAEQQQNNQQ